MPLAPSPVHPTAGSTPASTAASPVASAAVPVAASTAARVDAPTAVPVAASPAVPWPWQDSAACAGLPPAVVFTKRAKVAAPALRACAVCPVRRECEQAVAPAQSWFDGVCGGRLWRNGRPAALASSSGSPRV
ncbi:WhiB family transcriptional regulator [Streptomyces sp. NBC_01351]|uniref:WhiB family transcriptional regulator n=1 Tax=Streptomyces sp. NBC_01351 TaxID=2903833 RepID=UPI002E33A2A8|nr:WhiB family transcriptional regulator [Streptomyces sp. NBC_01351]